MHPCVSIIKTHSLMCVFWYLVVYTGSRMTAYEFLRNKVLKRNPDGKFALWWGLFFPYFLKIFFCHQCWQWVDTCYWSLHCRKSVIAGMTAGAFGQFIASPTDLVKVQMQMEGKRVLVEGRRPRYDVRWLRRIIINPLLPSSYCRACIVADWDYLLLLCAQLWYLLTITQFNL